MAELWQKIPLEFRIKLCDLVMFGLIALVAWLFFK